MTRLTRQLPLGLVAAVLLLGCAPGEDAPQSGAAEAPTQSRSADAAGAGEGQGDHGGHDGHGGGGRHDGHGGGAEHAGHDHGHLGPDELQAVMLTAADVPAGYRAGHAHHQETAAAPALTPGCAPLAELIGEHPSVRQSGHPEARVVMSKSHFGPTLGETVIDFGDQDAASEAVGRLDEAARSCASYQQSQAATGAQRYDVTAGPRLADRPGVSSVRLVASDDQFDIRWDLTWVQYGDLLVAVDQRSAPGGDNDDLAPALAAAIDKVETAAG